MAASAFAGTAACTSSGVAAMNSGNRFPVYLEAGFKAVVLSNGHLQVTKSGAAWDGTGTQDEMRSLWRGLAEILS